MFRSYSDNTVFQHQCGLRGPLGRTLCEPPAKGIQRLLPLHSQGPELGFAEGAEAAVNSNLPTVPTVVHVAFSHITLSFFCTPVGSLRSLELRLIGSDRSTAQLGFNLDSSPALHHCCTAAYKSVSYSLGCSPNFDFPSPPFEGKIDQASP
jgi:hypothetical protein